MSQFHQARPRLAAVASFNFIVVRKRNSAILEKGRGFLLQRNPNSLQLEISSKKRKKLGTAARFYLTAASKLDRKKVVVLHCSVEIWCCSEVCANK